MLEGAFRVYYHALLRDCLGNHEIRPYADAPGLFVPSFCCRNGRCPGHAPHRHSPLYPPPASRPGQRNAGGRGRGPFPAVEGQRPCRFSTRQHPEAGQGHLPSLSPGANGAQRQEHLPLFQECAAGRCRYDRNFPLSWQAPHRPQPSLGRRAGLEAHGRRQALGGGGLPRQWRLRMVALQRRPGRRAGQRRLNLLPGAAGPERRLQRQAHRQAPAYARWYGGRLALGGQLSHQPLQRYLQHRGVCLRARYGCLGRPAASRRRCGFCGRIRRRAMPTCCHACAR